MWKVPVWNPTRHFDPSFQPEPNQKLFDILAERSFASHDEPQLGVDLDCNRHGFRKLERALLLTHATDITYDVQSISDPSHEIELSEVHKVVMSNRKF